MILEMLTFTFTLQPSKLCRGSLLQKEKTPPYVPLPPFDEPLGCGYSVRHVGPCTNNSTTRGSAGHARSVFQHLVDERRSEHGSHASLDGQGAASHRVGPHRWECLSLDGRRSPWRSRT